MGGWPAVNNNLQRDTTPAPIAGVGVEGSLGGVRVDGTSITIDPSTGIVSASGGGGGVSGSGTAKLIPIWVDATTLGDAPIEYDKTFADTVYITATGGLKVAGLLDLFDNLTLENGNILLSDSHASVEASLYVFHELYNAATFPLPILGAAPARAFVSDALTQTFNDAYGAGGGTFTMPVFWNGVAWFIG